ncbi:MAG: hypothetical protein IJN90_02900 [Bacilli bacterium]|nr:hypothetical protein [Bacilli bacterium]
MEILIKQYVDEKTEIEAKTNMEIIKLLGIGKNATKMVKFADNNIGFYKNSALTTNAALDDFEYFISIMGREILGFELANVQRVFDENNEKIGIISENVANENERLMMFSDILDIITQNPTEELLQAATNIRKIREENMQTFSDQYGGEKVFPVVTNDEEIVQIIDMFSISIDNLNITKEEKDNMLKKYFEMIVLDVLTGQKDRTNNNYGILYNQQTKETRFSPLFDNSALHMPGVPDNYCQLNGFLIDRNNLMSVLVNNYSEITLDIINPILERKDDILTRSQRLSQRVLDAGQANMVMGTLTDGLNVLESITKQCSNKK